MTKQKPFFDMKRGRTEKEAKVISLAISGQNVGVLCYTEEQMVYWKTLASGYDLEDKINPFMTDTNTGKKIIRKWLDEEGND